MFARYEVKGHSMEPTLREGDRVVLLKTGKVKKGDIIVFTTTDSDCIKRVAAVNEKELIVKGNNKLCVTGSSAISSGQVIGKVLMKY